MWLACLNGWPSYNNFANKENKLNLPIDVMILFESGCIHNKKLHDITHKIIDNNESK